MQEELHEERHIEERSIRIARGAESREVPIREVCRQHNISEQAFCRWRNEYGGMEGAGSVARLKRLVAEQVLVIDGPKEFFRNCDNPSGRRMVFVQLTRWGYRNARLAIIWS
jgi:putative transposase